MVSKKFSSKNSKFYKDCMAHYIFCHPALSQFSIFFKIACKELKIVQIALLTFECIVMLSKLPISVFPVSAGFVLNESPIGGFEPLVFVDTSAELFSRRYYGV